MRLRRGIIGLFLAAVTLISVTPAEGREPFTVTECEGVTDSVFRLYTAALGRPAEQAGFEFWLGAYQRADFSLVSAANFFVNSPEFTALYGSLDNRAYVEQLYSNVLGRPGETGGVDFWTGQLDSGARSRAIVLLDFSESPENVAATATEVPSLGYFNRGLDGPWNCIEQPAPNTCTVVQGALAPTYDVMVTAPADYDGTSLRVRFDVFRNGVLLGNTGTSVSAVEPGMRVRASSAVGTAFNRGVPASEQTCAITGTQSLNGSIAGSPVFGDPAETECVVVRRDSVFGVIQLTSTVTNPLSVAGDQRSKIGLYLDGFRVDVGSGFETDVPAGDVVEIGSGMPGHVIPLDIDQRRATCKVLELYWLPSS